MNIFAPQTICTATFGNFTVELRRERMFSYSVIITDSEDDYEISNAGFNRRAEAETTYKFMCETLSVISDRYKSIHYLKKYCRWWYNH